MAKIKISEFNFDYAPTCDETVVRWLLENRQAVMSDIEYGQVNEDVIVTYADLDDVIAKAGLSNGQQMTIDLIMDGYTTSDISSCYGGQRQTYVKFYSRAVKKICDTTNQLWEQFEGNKQAKGICY